MATFRNFSAKLVGEAGVRLFSAATIFALAHVLGADLFGQFSSAFAFTSMFVLAVDLGTNAILTRDIARHPERRRLILGNANLLKAGATILTLAAIHFGSRWSAFARTHLLLIDAVGVLSLTYTLLDYLAALLAGKEEFGWEATLKIVCRAIIAAVGIGVLLRTHALLPTALGMAAACGVSLVAGMIIVYVRFGTYPILFEPDTMQKLVKSSLPLLGFVVFWTFYDNQDILILNYFRVAQRDIGLFWSAVKVVDVLKVIPVMISGVFFPSLARFAPARETFLLICRKLLLISIVSTLAVMGVVYVAAPYMERMLYGPQFVAAASLLRWLLPAYGLIFMNHMFLQILIARDRERKIMPGAMIACLSNLAFSYFWVPMYGTRGACYALIASEVLFFLFLVQLLLEAVPDLINPFRRTYG